MTNYGLLQTVTPFSFKSLGTLFHELQKTSDSWLVFEGRTFLCPCDWYSGYFCTCIYYIGLLQDQYCIPASKVAQVTCQCLRTQTQAEAEGSSFNASLQVSHCNTPPAHQLFSQVIWTQLYWFSRRLLVSCLEIDWVQVTNAEYLHADDQSHLLRKMFGCVVSTAGEDT